MTRCPAASACPYPSCASAL